MLVIGRSTRYYYLFITPKGSHILCTYTEKLQIQIKTHKIHINKTIKLQIKLQICSH